VDDDPVILDYVRLHLVTADFDVRVSPTAQAALVAIGESTPDLIISDIDMPQMDGFDFLATLRANPATEHIPFIFLTQNDAVEAMRRGMQLGANDFLSKPIRRAELLAAISGRLKILEGLRRSASSDAVPTLGMPVVQRTLNDAQSPLVRASARAARGSQVADMHSSAADSASHRIVDGTILFSDIRNFSTIAEKITASEVSELLNAYFAIACEPVLAQRGWVVKFIGDGVVAMFDNESSSSNHQARALKAGLLMTVAASQFQAWIDNRFANRGLPPFAIGVGLHCGEVSITQMDAGDTVEATVLGDVVNLASRLEATTKELGWSIAASAEVLLSAGERFVMGRSGQVEVKGREGMADIFEVVGLLAREDDMSVGDSIYDRITAAVADNTAAVEVLRRQREGESTIGMVSGSAAIRLDGYRLLSKLGQGGMSHVYLAEHIADGAQHVLKLIRIDANESGDGDGLQRFISEYALISQIDHPNVAKIFRQGFSESHAYIAMEYFPGGDLRQLMTGQIGEAIAVASLLQVAGALSAIHEKGIVHRDMKPDNIMIRSDGSLALADFGIATQIETELHSTAAGEVFGTPSYIAPEQATDSPVDHRADIYALGVMFYEMLAGKKPYRASSPQALLYQHVNSPIPPLPEEFAHYDPLIARMMAKEPSERFINADALIDAALSISPPNLN
jgi:class 3 adenylate cyclase